MSKVTVTPVTNGQNVSAINNNFQLLADALNDGTLWRDNPVGEPNQCEQDIDLNGFNILNVDGLNVGSLTLEGVPVHPEEVVVAGSLQKINNLSDVANASTAKANLGMANVDNTSDVNKPVSTATQTALNLKLDISTAASTYAPLASPTLTGDPKAPTPNTADNDTSIATTAYTKAQFAAAANNASFGTLAASGVTSVTNATASSASTNGALVVTGGIGVGNNVFVAGSVVAGGGFTGSIQGSNGTTDAAAGKVGEYIESVIAQGSPVALVTGTAKTITSISLTAGDWDVSCVGATVSAATTTQSNLQVGISTTTNTQPAVAGGASVIAAIPATANTQFAFGVPPFRIKVSTTTTVFMVITSVFAVSTNSGFGCLRARRIQ